MLTPPQVSNGEGKERGDVPCLRSHCLTSRLTHNAGHDQDSNFC